MNTSIYLIKNNWLPEDSCGWGNGYVVLPPNHEFHGKFYDDIMSSIDACEELTYSKADGNGNWVVGWDSAHLHQTMENYPMSVVLSQTQLLERQLNRIQ
jgi:hypothetical protein